MKTSHLWRVAVDAPLPEPLTYSSGSELDIRRGQRVDVPLGRRTAKGLVLGPADTVPDFEVKNITAIDTEYPELPEAYVRWLEWLSTYYLHPTGLTADLAYPPLAKQVKERKSKKTPVIPNVAPTAPPELTPEQKVCVEAIQVDGGFQGHLVFGVTGSGKTEIYLRLLERVLAEGKSGLVLVPEISLTPQLIQRFAARFGDQIAALHSQLTDRERTNQWWDIIEGRRKILIGARSALFCPMADLGLIIVDEEHEPSYKQEEKLKYHGRDAAVMMAKLRGIPIVLGTATPSLESWHNAREGKYQLHVLRQRVADRSLPEITVVDLRDKTKPEFKYPPDLPFWITPLLYIKTKETLDAGYQVALFLNRRGVAQLILCPACGHSVQCPNCDINLTLHGESHLVCHYCDYHENLKKKCSDCHEGDLQSVGLGTELIERNLARLFPGRVIARADRDEIQNRADLEDLVQRMESGETDILVGTQMIAKGLDFPKLKLVGLVLADIGFNLPDFRSTERSFQLITQMAGRSGRHVKPGEAAGQVVIQTFNTEHDSLRFALAHDYEGFAEFEIQQRQALNYPPAGRLASFRVQGLHLAATGDGARLLGQRARALREKNPAYAQLEILGPTESPLARLRNQFRFQMIVKSLRPDLLNAFSRQLLGDESWMPTGTRVLVDIDPMTLL